MKKSLLPILFLNLSLLTSFLFLHPKSFLYPQEQNTINTNEIQTETSETQTISTQIDETEKVLSILQLPFQYLTFPTELIEYTQIVVSETLSFERDLWNQIVKENLEKQRQEYIIEKELEKKPALALGVESWDTELMVRGNVNLNFIYGLKSRDEAMRFDPFPDIRNGFNLEQDMKVEVEGRVGKKVSIKIAHDIKSMENEYTISYKEPEKETKNFVREATIGNVSLDLPTKSKYVRYSGVGTSTPGVKFVGKTGPWSIQAVGTLTGNIPTTKVFTGKKYQKQLYILDVNYIKRKYFVLPDKNIDPASIKLYISTSLTNIATIYLDGLYYVPLISGVDFFISTRTGEIELKNPITRNDNLVIYYTHDNGLPISETNTNYIYIDETGKKYLYLRKASLGYSPYEHKGYYQIGAKDFDPTRGFRLYVIYTHDPEKIPSEISFSVNDYEINPINGLLKFLNKEPFPNREIYTVNYDPTSDDSKYTIVIELYETTTTYFLDFDIVPGSEEVKINGKVIPPSEYTIIYPAGLIYFKNPELINEGDKIEITYQYKPFFNISQALSLGFRADYTPFQWLNLGSTLVLFFTQRSISAPLASSTPPYTSILLNLDFLAKLDPLFQNTSTNIKGNIEGEVAINLVDPNTSGKAIVEDMENSTRGYTLTKDENSWYLSSASTNIGCFQTNRGQLLYKDYRKYYIDGSFSLQYFSWDVPEENKFPYTEKPGPYLVAGGHLDPSQYPGIFQTSLAMEYVFTNGEWVGIITSIAGQGGIDLSQLKTIYISYLLQSDNNFNDDYYDEPNTNEVYLYIEIGRLSEDLDGDGIFDYELSKLDGGFTFDDQTSGVTTKIGRGRKETANGILDTEDLNRNGVLDTDDLAVTFPSPSTTILTSVVLSGSGQIGVDSWKQVEINIAQLSGTQLDILKKAYAIRIILKKKSGVKGRILFDNIQLLFSSWRITKVDDVYIPGANQINATTISVYSSPYYEKHKFYNVSSSNPEDIERTRVFEELHGKYSYSEAITLDEKALRLRYNLANTLINTNTVPPTGGSKGTIQSSFLKTQDYSIYEKFVFYIYIPSVDENGKSIKTNGDTYNNEYFIVKFGGDEKKYYQWEIPLGTLEKNKWLRGEIILKDISLPLYINGIKYNAKISGFPSLREINYLEIGVKVDTNSTEATNTGEIWVNEIFLENDQYLFSTAYRVSGTIGYSDNLFSLFNFPIISNPSFSWSIEHILPEFRGIGGNTDYGVYTYNIGYKQQNLKYSSLEIYYTRYEEYPNLNIVRLPEYLRLGQASDIIKFSFLIQPPQDTFFPRFSHTFTDFHKYQYQNQILQLSNTNTPAKSEYRNINNDINFFLSQRLPYNILLNISYYAKHQVEDNSIISNIYISDVYITNNYTFGLESWALGLEPSLSFSYKNFYFNTTYKHYKEKYLRINTLEGFREKIEILENKGITGRYIETFSILTTFLENSPKDTSPKDLLHNLNLNTGTRSLFNFLDIQDVFNAEYHNFNYKYYTNNILLNDNTVRINNNYSITFGINQLVFKSLNIYSRSEVSQVIYTAKINEDKEIERMLNIFEGINPLIYKYIGLFGSSQRELALNFVNMYSQEDYRNSLRLVRTIGATLNLDWIYIYLKWLPEEYNFEFSTTTERNINSYVQSEKLVTYTSLNIPLRGIFVSYASNVLIPGSFVISPRYEQTWDYNQRQISKSISVMSTINWIIDRITVSLNYNISFNGLEWIKEIEKFEEKYNIGVNVNTNLALKSQITHQANLTINLPTKFFIDTTIFGIPIKLDSESLNRATISFSKDSVWYSNYNFLPFTEKLYEFSITLDSSIKYSKVLYLGGYFKTGISRYIERMAIGNEIIGQLYNPAFGLEFGIKLLITMI